MFWRWLSRTSSTSSGLASAAWAGVIAPLLHHQVERDAGAAARGLGVGGRRIIGRRLDEAGDDRRLGDRELGRAVAEEAARSGVDAIGAAAEIDAVEIELEDLVLGEAPFERHRQYGLAQLAGEAAIVVEEDVAGELLGDGRAALRPAAALDAHDQGADDADRIDADMRAEAAVLDRDHRVAHDRRDPVVGQPFAEHRAHRLDDVAIGGADPDHLAQIVAADELAIARQLADRDRDRDAKRDQADHHRVEEQLEAGDENPPEAGAGRGAGHWRLGIESASHGGKQKRETP